MKDTYTESIVPKSPTGKERVLLGVFLLLTSGCLVMAFLSSGVFLLAAALFGWIAWKRLLGLRAEYEYVHTNDIFDVDLVIGDSQRKELVSVNLEHVLLVAPVGSPALEIYGRVPATDYTGKAPGKPYAMIYNDGGNRQLTLQLDDRMVASLKPWLPGKVK